MIKRGEMIVAFEFNYLNENALIGYFLDFYAKKSTLLFRITSSQGLITLFACGEEDEILKFSDEYAALIPNSVFLAKSSVRVAQEMSEEDFEKLACADFSSPVKFSSFTPAVIKAYLEKGELRRNEFGELSGVSVLREGKFQKVNEENFGELLEFARLSLSHFQNIKIRLGGAQITLNASIDFKNSDFLLACAVGSLNKIFIADDKTQIALAAFEKPLISLKTNAIFRKNHADAPKFFDVKLASDLFIFALNRKLLEDDIHFLSARCGAEAKSAIFKVVPLKHSFLIVQNRDFLDAKSKELLDRSEEKNLALFALSCNEKKLLGKRVLRCFLGVGEDDEIAIYDKNSKKPVLKFAPPISLLELKEQICADETGAKLFANFTAKFSFGGMKFSAEGSDGRGDELNAKFHAARRDLRSADEEKHGGEGEIKRDDDLIAPPDPQNDLCETPLGSQDAKSASCAAKHCVASETKCENLYVAPSAQHGDLYEASKAERDDSAAAKSIFENSTAAGFDGESSDLISRGEENVQGACTAPSQARNEPSAACDGKNSEPYGAECDDLKSEKSHSEASAEKPAPRGFAENLDLKNVAEKSCSEIVAEKFPEGSLSRKASFYDVLDLASQILFNQSAPYLLACAADFLGEKGVRIDFSINDRGELAVDKLIRSAMSYKLAGVDDKVLSYGFIDSLSYFLSDLMDARRDEFDAAIFGGALFGERKFADLVLKLCRNHAASFSDEFALQAR